MGDNSSPDLSLKLRRGSSDSRDSFYMDFDKGIDSDIDEMATTSGADLADNTADTTATPTIVGHGKSEGASWPTIPAHNMSGGSRSSAAAVGDLLLPSPASPLPVIVSPETLSHSSQTKAIKQATHVQISPTTKRMAPGSLAITGYYQYYHQQQQYPVIRRMSRADKQEEWRQLGTDALATTLSALYGKLLVVMGTAFPMAEVISTYIPPSFYEAYYLYLYIGSMFFLLYMYTVLLRDKRKLKRSRRSIVLYIRFISARVHISGPISLRRYDLAELLQEEDKRDILRDVKTIYAPEFRFYSNQTPYYCNIGDRLCNGDDYNGIDESIVFKRTPKIDYLPTLKNDLYDKDGKDILQGDILRNLNIDETLLKDNPSGITLNNTLQFNLDLNVFTEASTKIGKYLSTVDREFSTDTFEINTKINLDNSSVPVNLSNVEYKDLLNITSYPNNKLTSSDIRKIQGRIMKKYMNPTANPCVDFYEYACGNWKNYYTIPPDRATYDTFEMVRENLDEALKGILEEFHESPSKNKPYFLHTSFLDKNFLLNDTSDATIKAKIFYRSCMREDVINKRGSEPLMGILRELGGWPIHDRKWNDKNFDLIWLLARLRLLNNDVLIAQWVGPDMKNSNQYIVHIDQTTLGLPAREYYLDDANMKYLRAYKVFILSVAGLLGADAATAEKDTDDIIDFEMQLARIMASTEERKNISDIYLRTDLSSLTLYFPQFDWKSYFDVVLGTNIDLATPVACYCARFLHELLYLLSNTTPRVLQNYILWRFIRHRTNNLDKKFMDAKQRFYYILFGREKNPPRWQFCVSQVNSNMGMALGSLFVRRYFDNSSKIDTVEMTKQLEEAFKTTLTENTWLDNNTKEYARMKLDYMDLKIGFPDFILNNTELAMRYYDVQVHQDYFFENILTILRHLTKVEQRRMGTTVNRTLWSTPPAVVNAYYSRNKNQIMFPAGMLQPPFYNRHFPKALNFGGIGVVIGHEITHGFDDKGRLFDHEGNLHMWWRESSIEKFYEKSQCLINQYGQYVLPEIKVALDGYLTQGENIADNGGLKQAYRAYDTWLKGNSEADESLPGLNLTGRQLFFLNFAQVWCGQQRIEAAKNRLKTSVHSPGIFRVIGVLSNSDEFAKEYDCPKNSPMNPEFKCIIW